jgi:hypothetical protein
LADWQYQPGILRDRNEFCGADHSLFRVFPAYQCLCTNRTFFAVNLLLVIKFELISGQSFAHSGFELTADFQRGLHGRIKESQRVASGFFRGVHGRVGLFEQIVEILPVIGKQGYAYARSTVMFDIFEHIGLADVDQHFLTHLPRLHGCLGSAFAQSLQ